MYLPNGDGGMREGGGAGREKEEGGKGGGGAAMMKGGRKILGKGRAPKTQASFFCGNVAGIPRKNFVILMGLPTFYLDS